MKKKKTTVQCKSLGIPLPEAIARQVDELVKKLPRECRSLRRKASLPTTELVSGERCDISMVSVECLDRENEVVLAKGLDLTTFQRNPVVTFAHQYDSLPVGKALWIKHVPGGVKAKTSYATRPADWQGPWLPDAIFSMTSEGILKGKSIGFVALRIRDASTEELASNPEWKHANAIIEQSLLLEYAVAPVPVNQDALVEAVSKGLADEATLKKLGLKLVQSKATDLFPLLLRELEKMKIDPVKIAAMAHANILERFRV